MTRELITQVEGTAFAVHVGVASGFKQFGRLLRSQKAVDALAQAARSDADIARIVLGRLVRLSRLRIDPRYENPNDVAIAAYLVVLASASSQLYRIAVDEVLSSTNLWWAAQIARVSIEEARQVSAAETFVIDGNPDQAASVNSIEATFPSGLFDDTFRRVCEGSSDNTGTTDRQHQGTTTQTRIEIASLSDSQYALAA
jgi:hypothetical protein